MTAEYGTMQARTASTTVLVLSDVFRLTRLVGLHTAKSSLLPKMSLCWLVSSLGTALCHPFDPYIHIYHFA
jgi:hypothetical protein